jgi:pimeloyl-ACP methyl ester carboxylesterase
MPDTFSLRGSQLPVEIVEASITVLAPGLVGSGLYHGKRETGQVRAATQEKGSFDSALAEAELEDRHTLEIDAPTPEMPRGAAARGTGQIADDEIELQVPSNPGEIQFALYADEDGILSLHIPHVTTQAEALPSRAPSTARLYTYRISLRRATGTGTAGEETRGVIGAITHKLIKIIVGKALQGVVRLGEFAAVKVWENKARASQGFHGGTFSQFLEDPPTSFADWKLFQGKRALLFIHGTTSSTYGAFEGLQQFSEIAERFWKAYDGRILGFNHHTLSKRVAENVADFYAALAASPGSYEFDVITHSRGGLMARAIAELGDGDISIPASASWSRPPGVQVKLRRIVFVGTPNAGTDLADPKNLPVTLDRLANAIHLLPDAPLTLALGAVFAVAAYFSETGLQALPGLVDQSPASPFLTRLNTPKAPPMEVGGYFGIEAEFHPDGGIASAILDKGVDKLFRGKPNDIIVPTLGVSEIASANLPVLQVKKYGFDDHVHHTTFFRHRPTWEYIAESLLDKKAAN